MKQEFKTNLKCSGCIAAITPGMDRLGAAWSVDLDHPDKVLTVTGDVSKDAVETTLQTAGFKAESLSGN